MDPCFQTATRLAHAIRSGKLSSIEATRSPPRAHRPAERADQRPGGRGSGRRDQVGKGSRSGARQESCQARARCTGVPITIKEAFDVAGLRTTSSHPPAQGQCRQVRCLPGREIARGRVQSSSARQTCPSCARTFRPTVPCSARQEPVGRPAVGRRLDRRRRRGRGGAPLAARARQRHRRLGAQSRSLQRHLFAQADPRVARCRRAVMVPDLPGVTRGVRYMGVFGPLARSVEDLETALRIIAGPDGHEAEAPPVPLGPTPGFKAKDLRIAVLESNPLVQGLGRHGKVVQATAKLLAKAGAQGSSASSPRASTGSRAGTIGAISGTT